MLDRFRRNFQTKSRFMKWLICNEVFDKRFQRTFKVTDYKVTWQGKTVIMTGVTRGVGVVILKKLLQLEMNVIIGCRNTLASQEFLLEIQQSDHIDISRALILELDFMSFKSVRKFAADIAKSKIPVHLFINNARIFGGEFSETNDGFDTHFQANCLSPFLLINLLLPIMKETSQELGSPMCRIITVSSALMYLGRIDFNDLEQRKSYNPFQVYFNTQLFQILLLRQLFTNIRNQDGYERINIYSVHAGITASELPCRKLSRLILRPFFTSKEDGASQVLYIALSHVLDRVSGEFFIHPNDARKSCCNCQCWDRNSFSTEYIGNLELQEKVWNIASNFTSNTTINNRKNSEEDRNTSTSTSARDNNNGEDNNMTVFYSYVDRNL